MYVPASPEVHLVAGIHGAESVPSSWADRSAGGQCAGGEPGQGRGHAGPRDCTGTAAAQGSESRGTGTLNVQYSKSVL